MNYAKPAVVAELIKGKAIAAVDHLAATLNWVISSLSRLVVRNGLEIQGLKEGKPIIGLQNWNSSEVDPSSGGLSVLAKRGGQLVLAPYGGGGGGGGSVTINGVTKSAFTIRGAEGNIHVSTSEDGTISIGAYYA